MFKINEILLDDNVTLIKKYPSIKDIERSNKLGTINYAVDTDELYLTIKETRNKELVNRILQEKSDGTIPKELTFSDLITFKKGINVGGTTITAFEKIAWTGQSIDCYYKNDEYCEINSIPKKIVNVEDALNILLYVPPKITSFTLDKAGTYENGTVINDLVFNWTLNKKTITQKINPVIGDLTPNLRTYSLKSQNINNSISYTLYIADDESQAKHNSDSKTVYINFCNKRYWGVSAKETLTDADILAFSSELSTSRNQTKTFNCSSNAYMYFAWPSNFGTPTFKIGGLLNSAWTLVTRNFTNALNYTTSYNIYRSNFLQTGSSIVVDVL